MARKLGRQEGSSILSPVSFSVGGNGRWRLVFVALLGGITPACGAEPFGHRIHYLHGIDENVTQLSVYLDGSRIRYVKIESGGSPTQENAGRLTGAGVQELAALTQDLVDRDPDSDDCTPSLVVELSLPYGEETYGNIYCRLPETAGFERVEAFIADVRGGLRRCQDTDWVTVARRCDPFD